MTALMKKAGALLLALALICLASVASASSEKITKDGYFKGIRLAGKVRVVEHFPDLKVKVDQSFPNLKVKAVEAFADDVGEWQFVDFGEDFTIQFVEHFPDITIKFVNAFPGVVN